MKRQILSLSLLFCILLTTIPLAVYADNPSPLGQSSKESELQVLGVSNSPSSACELWRVHEISLIAADSYSNPFLEVELTATFISPSGTTIIRPGFWDGDDDWKVRFAPTELGVWTYYITSNQPTDTGLNGNTGSFTCTAYSGSLDIYQKGFLQQDDSNRYLTYADGTPFFWLGDTHWFFANKERWDESNLAGTNSQFQHMVDTRASQGFTVYQTVIFGKHDSFWEPDSFGTKINADYFKDNVDLKMEYIADQGLVNAFGVGFSSNVDDFVDGERLLAKYTIARYGAYPMAYITAGEVAAGTFAQRKEERLDGWEQVARETHLWDSYNHPQTAHYTALSIQATETGLPSYYIGQGWMDFIMLQGGHSYIAPQEEYQYYSDNFPMPMLEAEANYEMINNGWATEEIVRRSAYRSIQAGGFGYTYGANGIWNAVWDDQDSDDESGYGHVNWDEAIAYPGAGQMGYMREFYESIPFDTLMPVKAVQASWSNEVEEYENPVIKADAQYNVITVFYPPRAAASGELSGTPKDSYTYQWFNPRTGDYDDNGTTHSSGGVLALPEMPDSNDWMLLLERDNPETLDRTSVSPEIQLAGNKAIEANAVVFELNNTHEISYLQLSFATLEEQKYILELSKDGSRWTTVLDRSGAGIIGKSYRENISGEAKFVRINGLDSSKLSTLDVRVYGKPNQYAHIESNFFMVNQLTHVIHNVPEGISFSEFLGQTHVPVNSTVALSDSEDSGRISDDTTVTIRSGDGAKELVYTIETVENEGDNLALRKPVTASSVENPYYSAQGVTDGNSGVDNFHGWSANDLPAWIEIDFGERVSFNKVKLFTKRDYEIQDYTVQYLKEGNWVDCFPTVTDNVKPIRSHFFDTVTSDKLRVYTTKGSIAQDDTSRIQELEVYHLQGNLVQSIAVTSDSDTITTVGGTLQMQSEVTPSNANITTVSWRIEDAQGRESRIAKISRTGLLTASGNGRVKVIARSRDGSEIEGEYWITITGQQGSTLELLSQGKPTSVSDQMGHATSDQAVDGDFTNGWLVNSGSMPHWLLVDLEEVCDIAGVEQTFFMADDYTYMIEGSLTGDIGDWFTLYSKTETNPVFYDTFSHEVTGQARFIRLTILGSTSQWAGSREFQVFGQRIIPEYTVTFHDQGAVYHTAQIEKGSMFGSSFPMAPVQANHQFVGWFTELEGRGVQVTDATPILKDEVVYAYYIKHTKPSKQYTVTFKLAEAVYETVFVEEGLGVGGSFPQNPQKQNHLFIGWFTEENGKGQQITAKQGIVKDMTVYAYFQPMITPEQEVTVTFLVDEQMYQTLTVQKSLNFGKNFPTAPTRSGSQFMAWTFEQDGMKQYLTEETFLEHSLVVRAEWKKIENPTKPTSPTPPSSQSVGGSAVPDGNRSNGLGTKFSTKATPVTRTEAEMAVKKALANTAKTSKKVHYAILKNPSLLSMSIIKKLQELVGGRPFMIVGDSMAENGTSVAVRMSVEIHQLQGNINLAASLDAIRAKQIKSLFNAHFSNLLDVLVFEQISDFGVIAEISVKSVIPLDGLHLYSYNSKTNQYKLLSNSNHWIDENGYLHFATTKGDTILIVNQALTPK